MEQLRFSLYMRYHLSGRRSCRTFPNTMYRPSSNGLALMIALSRARQGGQGDRTEVSALGLIAGSRYGNNLQKQDVKHNTQ